MALIPCHECKAEISTQAKACPQCGAKAPAKTRGWLLALLIIPTIFLTWAAFRTPTVAQDAMYQDRLTIAQCWKDQSAKSNIPEEARSIAALCEGLEAKFQSTHNRNP